MQNSETGHAFSIGYFIDILFPLREEIACNNTKNKKTVIYTAIMGDMDELIDPKFIQDSVDYICFTDSDALKSDVWKIYKINFKHITPRRTAKIFKIIPSYIFENYLYSIWMDGCCEIIGTCDTMIALVQGNYSMCCFAHPSNNCIYHEADTCIMFNKDNPNIINNQIKYYKEQGYPEKNGLIMGTVLARRHHDKQLTVVMEHWMEEIENRSVRDQISFNYIAWKFGFEYCTYPVSQTISNGSVTCDNDFVRFSKHKSLDSVKRDLFVASLRELERRGGSSNDYIKLFQVMSVEYLNLMIGSVYILLISRNMLSAHHLAMFLAEKNIHDWSSAFVLYFVSAFSNQKGNNYNFGLSKLEIYNNCLTSEQRDVISGYILPKIEAFLDGENFSQARKQEIFAPIKFLIRDVQVF